eukprot:s93_g41.t1
MGLCQNMSKLKLGFACSFKKQSHRATELLLVESRTKDDICPACSKFACNFSPRRSSFQHSISYEAMETMEAMADRDLSVFMGRMDKLCQRLSDWKSATPQRSQSRSTSQSLANRSGQLSQLSGQLSGQGLARSFVKLRQTETASNGSRLWNTGGSQEGACVDRESSILKPSTRGRPSRSPRKALVSILPYSAKDWLNDEAKVSQVSQLFQVSQTERTLKPSLERVEAPQPSELPGNEWQRSRNKLIDGSPSRRRRVESKSPKRISPSLSPSSRRSNRSRDALSPENPLQTDRPSEVRSFETLKNPSEDTKGSEDSQVNSSFESRIQALQQKARGLPRPHMESRSWSRNRDPPKGGGSPIARQDFQEQVWFLT